MSDLVVLALGGNAIKKSGESGTPEEQLHNVDITAKQIAAITEAGYRVILTHGNGPQVGSLLIQQEAGKDLVPEQPLYGCGAMTQGHIGWMLQNRIRFRIRQKGLKVPVATVITQVVVDPEDPDFRSPSKPVGPFYTKPQAEELADTKGYLVREVKPGTEKGWRRVVPSPMPQDILEKTAIRTLAGAGLLVVASGGGGVPVKAEQDDEYVGLDAVIDKDRAAVLLAELVEADRFVILTDVPNVLLNYNTPEERSLERVSVEEMDGYVKEGHFLAGSMGPKVEAALRFAKETGKIATITSLEKARDGLLEKTGTQIVP